MTEKEAIQVLAILKAAYPNSYKGMSAEEAKGTAIVWAIQFAAIPAEVVMIAVNKLVSSNPFPPAISEVKKKISGMYWEAWEGLQRKNLSKEQEAKYTMVLNAASLLRRSTEPEPTLHELTGGSSQLLLG